MSNDTYLGDQPGDWAIHINTHGFGFVFNCPCGCGDQSWIPICLGTKEERAWLWDGDAENPTLTPSILRTTRCKWHGYFQAGKWNWCPGTPAAENCLNRGQQQG